MDDETAGDRLVSMPTRAEFEAEIRAAFEDLEAAQRKSREHHRRAQVADDD